MDNKFYLLALNMVKGLGPLRIKVLLEYFSSPSDIFEANRAQLMKVPGLGKEIIKRLKEFDFKLVEEEFKLCQENGIEICSIDDPSYPELLKQIPDPPPILYVKGEFNSGDLRFAIVGSRRASFYGISVAERFGYELASLGFCIVSGMARGVDSAAHRGALNAGGKTIAVLGSGLLNIYPPENKELAKEIASSGALISEFPLRTPPARENFPRRNRIISGLSCGVLVVEAGLRSGALITADLALEQGRDVFAIPGRLNSPTSVGTNKLIKQGAKLVQDIQDILEEYGINIERANEIKSNLELDPRSKKIIDTLREEEADLDELVIKTGLGIQELNQLLLELEVKGIIKQHLPGKYCLR